MVASTVVLLLLGWPSRDPLASVPVEQLRAIEDLGPWPERLLEALDLEHPGLEAAREAHAQGRTHAAARHVLQYFLDQPRPFIDVDPPFPHRNTALRLADAYLQEDRVLLQNKWGPIVRTPAGRINWGDRGPRNDLEWTWMLNRQGVVLALVEAYAHTGKLDYLHAAETMVIDWITSHPVPRLPDLAGPWRALEAARRVDEAFRPLLAHHPHAAPLSESAHLLLLASLADHGDYLERFHALEGNHLLTEMTKLLHLSLLFPEFKNAPSWRAYALDKLHRETQAQVYPDGAHKELSNHYQRVVLRNYERLHDLLVRAGESEELAWFVPRMEAMWDYYAWMTKPDGTGVLNNDSDEEPNARVLLDGVRQFGREDWRYLATAAEAGIPSNGPRSRFFPWAGHAVMRDGWEPSGQWAYLDFGFYGTDHQHDDRLHLSLSAGAPGGIAQNFLLDNGRYTYRPGPDRDYFAGPRAHNIILLNGQGTEQPPLKARERIPAVAAIQPDHDFFRAEASYPRLGRHVRGVFYKRGEYWLVFDGLQVYGHQHAETLWHFGPNVTLTKEGDAGGILATASDEWAKGAALWVLPAPQPRADWQLHLEQGWHAYEYNRKLEAPMLRYETYLRGPRTVAWLLLPTWPDGPQPPALHRLDAPDGAIAVELNWPDGRTERVVARLFGPELPDEVAGVSTRGEYGWQTTSHVQTTIQ